MTWADNPLSAVPGSRNCIRNAHLWHAQRVEMPLLPGTGVEGDAGILWHPPEVNSQAFQVFHSFVSKNRK
jgi:hypothetical protein